MTIRTAFEKISEGVREALEGVRQDRYPYPDVETAIASDWAASWESEMRIDKARERAARALCKLAGNPENTTLEGRPMWESYLPEVDAVLAAVLRPADPALLDLAIGMGISKTALRPRQKSADLSDRDRAIAAKTIREHLAMSNYLIMQGDPAPAHSTPSSKGTT